MATFNKLPSGYRRVQARRKGLYVSGTFRQKFARSSRARDARRGEARRGVSGLARERTGTPYRLPTEAERDAVRAGKPRPKPYGGGPKGLCTYGNFADRKPASPPAADHFSWMLSR